MKTTRLFSIFATAALTFFAASCANNELTQDDNQKKKDAETPVELTTFVSGTESAQPKGATRTSMNFDDGNFFWEQGDKIYVKDDNDTWQTCSNAVDVAKVSHFKFMMPGKYAASTKYTVYYPGMNGTNDQVTIATQQSQAEPDNTTHIGTSGDCGMATATKSGGRFNFQLDHKASILVFQPYTSNSILQKCYILRIEVTADNNIAGTYTLTPDPSDATTGSLTGSGNSKKIVLTTMGVTGSTTEKGFPLATASASVTTNGAYMVIAPGTHKLKVRFWIKDYVSGTEGAITKSYPAFNYEGNGYYDMAVDLSVRDYNQMYYMWDAKQNYWYQHEWGSADPWQPTTFGGFDSRYPQSATADPNRWYNTVYNGYGHENTASQNALFKNLPNVNEMVWYVMKGDPHRDPDELWTTMGLLYRSGLWIKKKARIAADNSKSVTDLANAAPNGTDYRSSITWPGSFVNNSVSAGSPDADELGDYFFLPALSHYTSGSFQRVGYYGNYWSSNADARVQDHAFFFGFDHASVRVADGGRIQGLRAQPFE